MAKRRASRKRTPLEVWKFGGASLADAAAVRHAVALVRAHRGPLVVVVSALAGVTDALLDGARRAVAGRPEAASAVAASFRRRHGDLARALVPRGKARRALVASADAQAREYEEIAHAMAALADLSPRASDTLVARGERAASAVVASALQAAGRRAARVDAASFVATDGRHGSAAPDLKATRTRARTALAAAARARDHARGAGLHRLGARRHRDDARARRLGPDRDARRARARRRARRAVEGRGGHPDRRPARRARRAAAAAARPARGGRGRLLRRQGAAPARAHPARRHAHRAPRALLRAPGAAGDGGLDAQHARGLPGEGARHDPRPGARDRGRQGPDGRAGHGGADVCRDPRRGPVGVHDLPVLLGELDRLHAAGGGSRRGRRRRSRPRSATSSPPGSWTASTRARAWP